MGDQVYEYMYIRVAWECLVHMVRVDAEREGNRPMLMSLWEYDMQTLLQNNHRKYMIHGYRLLSSGKP